MLNIFKRKKQNNSEKLKELSLEEKISRLINQHFNSEDKIEKIEFHTLEESLAEYDSGSFFSLSNGSDTFNCSVFLSSKINENDLFLNKLNEISSLEVLQYPYKKEHYIESLWSLSNMTLYSSLKKNYFICINENPVINDNHDTLKIDNSSQFLFGELCIESIDTETTKVNLSYENVTFSPIGEKIQSVHSFESKLLIDNKELLFYYQISIPDRSNKNQFEKYASYLVKIFIKQQIQKIGFILKKKVFIKSARRLEQRFSDSQSFYSLKGNLYTGNNKIPYTVLFPKRLLKLFPDYTCTTVKGKILQINKTFFRNSFDSFYRFHKSFLFVEYLSLLDKRDMNLICQNFFMAHSIGAEEIRKLFYYKFGSGEKTKIQYLPLPGIDNFLKALPVRLRERYNQSKSASENYEELGQKNKDLMEKIYSDLNDGKLLLSYKSQFILKKEFGLKEKETKLRRLKGLLNEKKYLNSLQSFDNKQIQILFSNMKNLLITDTFIYQTDQLIKIKPYLSRRRFSELQEDILFTQGKIKTNQIDINRICDSIEKFNGILEDFKNSDQIE